MAIFKQPPIQWGFLGNSYLWRKLAQYFSGKDMPPERHTVLKRQLSAQFGY